MGLATLEALHGVLGAALGERVVCFGSSRRRLTLRGGLDVDQAPLAELARLSLAPTLVLHLAFLTQEKAGWMAREDYVATNRAISEQVFGSLDAIGATGLFVASSGAVELAARPGAEPNRALYGALKLEDEARAAEWAERTAGRAVIARIYGLSGPYINKQDSYALSCFIADALAGRPIAVRSAFPVWRSYVATDELMSLAFALLTDGAAGTTVFDTAGARGYEMSEIAAGVGKALGHSRGVTRPPLGGCREDRYVGDGEVYARLCARHGVAPVDFARQVRETAIFMAEAVPAV